MTWTKPSYQDLHFGFGITMSISPHRWSRCCWPTADWSQRCGRPRRGSVLRPGQLAPLRLRPPRDDQCTTAAPALIRSSLAA